LFKQNKNTMVFQRSVRTLWLTGFYTGIISRWGWCNRAKVFPLNSKVSSSPSLHEERKDETTKRKVSVRRVQNTVEDLKLSQPRNVNCRAVICSKATTNQYEMCVIKKTGVACYGCTWRNVRFL